MTADQLQTSLPGNDDSGSNLWRVLEVVALRRRFIFTFIAVATVSAVVISLILPKWYRAEALLLPPKEERLPVTSLGGDLSEWTSITGGVTLPVMATVSDVYVRMLNSRAAAVSVIDSLGLREYYEVSTITEALIALADRTDFRVTPEGLIQVLASDLDPQMAAAVANQFVSELDKIVEAIHEDRTGQSLEFVATALVSAKENLDSARARLRVFQEQNRTIDLSKQTEIAIASAAELKAKLASTEVELNLKRRALSDSHPEVAELRGTVSEMRSKISELEFGSEDSSFFALPIADAPRLTAELAELTAQVKVSELLHENLSLRQDEIRVQARRDAPTVSVLDSATPPEIRYRPQRTLIVASTFGVSLALAILFAVFFEYLANLERRSPSDFRRARFFFDNILGGGKRNSQT